MYAGGVTSLHRSNEIISPCAKVSNNAVLRYQIWKRFLIIKDRQFHNVSSKIIFRPLGPGLSSYINPDVWTADGSSPMGLPNTPQSGDPLKMTAVVRHCSRNVRLYNKSEDHEQNSPGK